MEIKFCSLKNKVDGAHCFYTGSDQIDSEGKKLFMYSSVMQNDPNITTFLTETPKLHFVRLLNNKAEENPNKITALIAIHETCELKRYASIGDNGFGFVRDENNIPIRFPHIGGVKLGNFVEIGDFTTVCLLTIDDTIIDDHSKIDDHVHIAHNVIIGKRTLVVAGSVICGSVEIGDDCWIGAQSVIREGLKIGNNVTIGMGAVVTKNVPDGETWIGNPARKMNVEIKNQIVDC